MVHNRKILDCLHAQPCRMLICLSPLSHTTVYKHKRDANMQKLISQKILCTLDY